MPWTLTLTLRQPPTIPRMRTCPAVSASGLSKSYGDAVVLDGIDLDVPAGTVFALLGPNGAGKTTVVSILSTLIPADGGTASVAGHDVATEPVAVRRSIGVTGQFSALDDLLTGRENLQLVADLHHLAGGRRLVAELLERFDLTDAADRRVSTWSGGMHRRLDLAMTLVGGPRLIFLDEPTTGLDPRSRRGLWEVVRELVADGVTVVLTTQYLEEADELADRIALLDAGRIVAEGTPAELKARVPGGSVQVRFTAAAGLHDAARRHPGAVRDDDALTLTVPGDGTPRSLRRLLDSLPDDESVADLALHTPDLDDVFLALTGHTSEKETAR
jgi:ABC-2 type transport system ATP-binding protein